MRNRDEEPGPSMVQDPPGWPYWSQHDPGPSRLAILVPVWFRTLQGGHTGRSMIWDPPGWPYWSQRGSGPSRVAILVTA